MKQILAVLKMSPIGRAALKRDARLDQLFNYAVPFRCPKLQLCT